MSGDVWPRMDEPRVQVNLLTALALCSSVQSYSIGHQSRSSNTSLSVRPDLTLREGAGKVRSCVDEKGVVMRGCAGHEHATAERERTRSRTSSPPDEMYLCHSALGKAIPGPCLASWTTGSANWSSTGRQH